MIFDCFIKTYLRVRLSMTADVTQRIVLCFVSVKHQDIPTYVSDILHMHTACC